MRPDVFARINSVPVAFEVQLSNLSPETIAQRTEEYRRLGIHVVWLLQWTPKLNRERYSPRLFERWVHAAYFGRCYFWQHTLMVLPVRFTELEQYVEKFDWRDRHGTRKTGGGYSRPSRRFRGVLPGRPLHLIRDFKAVRRAAWQGGTLTVPEALLYLDNAEPFSDLKSSRAERGG